MQIGIQRRTVDAGADISGDLSVAAVYGHDERAPSFILAQGNAVLFLQNTARMKGGGRKCAVGKKDVSLRIQSGQRHSSRVSRVGQQPVKAPVAFQLLSETEARGDVHAQVVRRYTGGCLYTVPYLPVQRGKQQRVIDKQTAGKHGKPSGESREPPASAVHMAGRRSLRHH